jgi:hypothetical protein
LRYLLQVFLHHLLELVQLEEWLELLCHHPELEQLGLVPVNLDRALERLLVPCAFPFILI